MPRWKRSSTPPERARPARWATARSSSSRWKTASASVPAKKAWKRSAPEVSRSIPHRRPGSSRLPEFKAIAFRVSRPTEAAIVIIFDPIVNLHARRAKLRQHRIEVFHPIVDHQRRAARAKILRIEGKSRPNGLLPRRAGLERAKRLPRLNRHPQMLSIPSGQRLRIPSLKKHAPDSENAFHNWLLMSLFLVRPVLIYD